MYSCFVHSGLVSIATSPTVLVPSLVVAPLLRVLKLQAFFLTLAWSFSLEHITKMFNDT